MFDKFDFNQLLSKAQEMQSNLQEKQKELKKKTYESSVGGGMVVVTMNGNYEVLSIKIEKDVLQEEQNFLQDLIKSAINEATAQVRKDNVLDINNMDGMLENLSTMNKK